MNRAALLVLLLSLASGPAGAGAPPEPLCSVCDTGFEEAASERGVPATVTNSTVEVVLASDGTARWTVRNRLANRSTAEELRSNTRLLDAIVGESFGEFTRPKPVHVSNVSARVVDRTVAVTFDHSSFADREGGVLVADYLHSGRVRGSYGIDADRFAVVGPAGTAVTNDPAIGQVRGNRVTVVNRGEEGYHFDDSVPDAYLVFASDDGATARAATHLALAARAAPAVLTNLAFLLPAAVVFAGGMAALGRTGPLRRFAWHPSGRTFAGGVTAVGLLAVVHPVYTGSAPLVAGRVHVLSGVGVVAASAGGLALWATVRGRPVPRWSPFLPVLAAPAFAAAAAVAGLGSPYGLDVLAGSVAGPVVLASQSATRCTRWDVRSP
ncbi:MULTISPECIES: hypothetical protein [Halorussus]|uniref:hypothetical protein n=1 Tax=Halorussus TaxID=1070314 RepID=UPI00209EAC02|nr:hypothetical protein [Halorussus vallis]USZ78035.1 hypothetical protein NGM07_20445 [Halorussus vallis]